MTAKFRHGGGTGGGITVEDAIYSQLPLYPLLPVVLDHRTLWGRYQACHPLYPLLQNQAAPQGLGGIVPEIPLWEAQPRKERPK